jgi:ribose transport system permease protein
MEIMTTSDQQESASTDSSVVVESARRREDLIRRLAPLTVLGLLVALIIVFGALRPDTFLTFSNFQGILGQNSVLVLVALGAMVPLVANEFDLSVAYVLGLGCVLVAGLTSKNELPVPVAVVIVLLICAGIGVIHAVLIVGFGLPSFVTTLGTGTAIYGFILLYSEGKVIFNLPEGLKDFGGKRLLDLQLPVFYALGIALVLWFVLEKRPWGRNLYATGAGLDAARLAGLPTARLRATALIVGSTLAGFAGIIFVARVGAASPTASQSFFLPAFAAVFLGTAAFKVGFFNTWGTILAVLLIGVGVTGLNLMGVPFWVEPMFNGGALLVAIAFSRASPASSG